jgi:hypothetical protein
VRRCGCFIDSCLYTFLSCIYTFYYFYSYLPTTLLVRLCVSCATGNREGRHTVSEGIGRCRRRCESSVEHRVSGCVGLHMGLLEARMVDPGCRGSINLAAGVTSCISRSLSLTCTVDSGNFPYGRLI